MPVRSPSAVTEALRQLDAFVRADKAIHKEGSILESRAAIAVIEHGAPTPPEWDKEDEES